MIQEAYVQGISTRSVDELVKALGLAGISRVGQPPVRGDRPARAVLPRAADRGRLAYLWIDATYVKVREAGRM